MDLVKQYFIRTVFCIVLVLLLGGTCDRDLPNNKELLIEASSIISNNPQQAYTLLSSINQPQNMDEEDYMLYKLLITRSKQTIFQDVAVDSSIKEVSRYFDTRNEVGNVAYAHLYTGIYYIQNKNTEEAIKHFDLAYSKAEADNNIVLMGKIQDKIGYAYLFNNEIDSSVVHIGEALKLYRIAKNTEHLYLKSLKFLSTAYLKQNSMDKVRDCINEGLEMAENLGDESAKSSFLRLKGHLYFQNGNYDKSQIYLHKALKSPSKDKDSLLIYLGFASLFDKTNQPDSAEYYISRFKFVSPNSTYKPTLKYIYATLSKNYHEQGRSTESLYYKELENEVDEEILKSYNAQKIIEEQHRYAVILKNEQQARQQVLTFAAILFCLVLILAVTLVFHHKTWAKSRLKLRYKLYEENKKLLESRHKSLEKDAKAVDFLVDMLRTVVEKNSVVEKQLQNLQDKCQTSQKPEIFSELEVLIGDIKNLINKQLIFFSIKYFEKETQELLNDREVLYITLRSIGFENDKIYESLDFSSANTDNPKSIKSQIRKKLKEIGISDNNMTLSLFSQNKKQSDKQSSVSPSTEGIIDKEVDEIYC